MNKAPAMKNEMWPEFVTDAKEASPPADLTGGETVTFELDDQEVEELLSFFSALSTAAVAP